MLLLLHAYRRLVRDPGWGREGRKDDAKRRGMGIMIHFSECADDVMAAAHFKSTHVGMRAAATSNHFQAASGGLLVP